MDRITTRFFTGIEIERSPAYSLQTLFVVGAQPINEIIDLANEHDVEHIYLGANNSYSNEIDYNETIPDLIANGFVVTLDYPITAHDHLLANLYESIWSNENFIAMLSCKVSQIKRIPNLTIKIDDQFNGTNNGVWCFSPDEVLSAANFTAWEEYEADIKIS